MNIVEIWSRGGALFIRRFITVHWRTSAHQMLVAVDVVDPRNRGPELGFGSDEWLKREKESSANHNITRTKHITKDELIEK